MRLLKLGMIYPLEREIVRTFASGLSRIMVVEEKRGFLEAALRDVLYDAPDRPPGADVYGYARRRCPREVNNAHTCRNGRTRGCAGP